MRNSEEMIMNYLIFKWIEKTMSDEANDHFNNLNWLSSFHFISFYQDITDKEGQGLYGY